MAADQRPRVGILLFDDVEVLDFAGPYEVFAYAADPSGTPYFRTVTIAQQPEVRCRGGLRVIADVTYDDCPSLDILVVPGGPGARADKGWEGPVEFIRQRKGQVKILSSVCTGSFLLARAKVLEGLRATTHRSRLAAFRAKFPHIRLVEDKIVDEGHIITAGGVSSGIDLALYILERWFGSEARRREARRLEGPWH